MILASTFYFQILAA